MDFTFHPSTSTSRPNNDPIHEDEKEKTSEPEAELEPSINSIAAQAEVAKSTTEFSTVTQVPERWVTLQFTWAGKPFSLDIADSDR